MTVNGRPSRRTSARCSGSERTNDGDVVGVAALYEPNAVVAASSELVNGSEAIRRLHKALLADPPQSPVTYARLYVGAVSLRHRPASRVCCKHVLP